jgi:predicted DNA-binding transcriptional regulator YafY
VSRADRLLRLVRLLRRHRAPISASRLAAELGVSVRSIYRDVETLREQGAAIDGEAGIGYLLRPGFLLPPLMFADEELEAIVLGLRLTAEHGDDALGRAAREVVAKIRAVLPRRLRDLVDDTALLAGPTPRRPADTVDIAEIRRVIRVGRKAGIEYLTRDAKQTRRVVWPIGLDFFERARVLIAWCEMRQDFRSFRTDRIRRWTTLGERLPQSRTALLSQWREREGVPAQLPD